METETVLELEFQPVFDKWAWRIIKQNEEILKRGEFVDKEIGVSSICFSDFYRRRKVLFLRGSFNSMDDKINICTSEEKTLIEEKVRAINEKYGIKKRWRAKRGEEYFYVNDFCEIYGETDFNYAVDGVRYDFGNYFKTEAEALEYAEHMKKCSLKWHEKRGKNNG